MENCDTEYAVDLFFETSPNLLCIAGYDGYFKRINPAVCQTLGYTEEELMARKVREFIHPEDQSLTAQHRDAMMQGKPIINFENRYLTKEGKVVWLSWNTIPIVDRELAYAIAKDISHIKQREAHRNELLSELTRINQRMKRLTAATTHDIRSPLSGFLALLNLLDPTAIPDPSTREIMGAMKLSAEKLMEMLDGYVENLRHDDSHVSVEVIDFQSAYDRVHASIAFLLERSSANIHLNFEGCRTVTFNRNYLDSIFLNLMTNSIKYAHPDRNLECVIHAQKVSGGVELIFVDNGIGFDSKRHEDQIFGLHQKFHEHDDSKGVGLYLIHHFMSSFGGSISVESQVGEGAEFTLFFPDR